MPFYNESRICDLIIVEVQGGMIHNNLKDKRLRGQNHFITSTPHEIPPGIQCRRRVLDDILGTILFPKCKWRKRAKQYSDDRTSNRVNANGWCAEHKRGKEKLAAEKRVNVEVRTNNEKKGTWSRRKEIYPLSKGGGAMSI